MIKYWTCMTFVQYVTGLNDSRSLKGALVWKAGGGKLGQSFHLSDSPVTKLARGRTFLSFFDHWKGWQVAATNTSKS